MNVAHIDYDTTAFDKGDGRTGGGESLLALLLLEFGGRQVPDQDLIRLLLLMRIAGTSSGGAAEALVLQRLMQSFARAGDSAGAATGITAPGHDAHTTERGPESRRQQS